MQRTLFALLCLAVFCSAAQASCCNFTIVSYPDTDNTTDGPISSIMAIPDSISSAQPTASKSELESYGLDNNVNYINFSGTNCNFNVEFWSNDNFNGAFVKYSTSGKTSGKITLSSTFGHQVSSYKFSY